MFHVCSIATCAKDDGYLGSRADVVRRYEGAGGVVYKCR